MILPWLHPVMTPPYRYLLRHVPRSTSRVVICHNVEPHEAVRGPPCALASDAPARGPHRDPRPAPARRARRARPRPPTPLLEAFHRGSRPTTSRLSRPRRSGRRERARQGDPDLLLLTFGSIRPYKGIDIALDALARVDPSLHVRLVVAGPIRGTAATCSTHRPRGSARTDASSFVDRFISNEEAALLFSAADASLLPYRSASQSGVVQLSFAYERPVIATRVGGLPAAIDDGVTGILCEPGCRTRSHARSSEWPTRTRTSGTACGRPAHTTSFHRYSALLDDALAGLRS